MAGWLSDIKEGVRLQIRIVPRASRNQVDGVQGASLKIRLTAPPVEGAANKALMAFLAKKLGVPKRTIYLVRGEHRRTKQIVVEGISAAEVQRRLL